MADTMDTLLTSRARRVAVQRPRAHPVPMKGLVPGADRPTSKKSTIYVASTDRRKRKTQRAAAKASVCDPWYLLNGEISGVVSRVGAVHNAIMSHN